MTIVESGGMGLVMKVMLKAFVAVVIEPFVVSFIIVLLQLILLLINDN